MDRKRQYIARPAVGSGRPHRRVSLQRACEREKRTVYTYIIYTPHHSGALKYILRESEPVRILHCASAAPYKFIATLHLIHTLHMYVCVDIGIAHTYILYGRYIGLVVERLLSL